MPASTTRSTRLVETAVAQIGESREAAARGQGSSGTKARVERSVGAEAKHRENARRRTARDHDLAVLLEEEAGRVGFSGTERNDNGLSRMERRVERPVLAEPTDRDLRGPRFDEIGSAHEFVGRVHATRQNRRRGGNGELRKADHAIRSVDRTGRCDESSDAPSLHPALVDTSSYDEVGT